MPVTALLGLLLGGSFAACTSPTPSVPTTSTTGPTTGPLTAVPATPAAPTETAGQPTPTPTTATTVSAPCSAADLKASHALVEGAAGSRLTEIVLVAAVPCSVDAFPTLGFRDANGAAILGGVASGSGRIDLSTESSYTSSVRISNFCAENPEFPLTLELRLGAEELAVTGPSFDEADLPPCNGGGGATLEAGAWTPGP